MSKSKENGEHYVSKEDKEKILTLWSEIETILNKYKTEDFDSDWINKILKAKMAAYVFAEWIKLLQTE